MKAERKSTSVSRPSRRIAASTWVPSSPGMRMSSTATVGPEVADPLERLAPVAGLADQLEVGPVVDRAHDPLPVDRVIVGDQHGHAVRVRPHRLHDDSSSPFKGGL